MNLNLKAIYYCATDARRWGKGYTIAEAKKNAGLKGSTKGRQYYVQAALFDNPNEEELDNLFACITSEQISGGPIYYQTDRTEADTEMINKFHVGWLMIEKNL